MTPTINALPLTLQEEILDTAKCEVGFEMLGDRSIKAYFAVIDADTKSLEDQGYDLTEKYQDYSTCHEQLPSLAETRYEEQLVFADRILSAAQHKQGSQHA